MYKIIERTEITNTHSMFDYDENGNPIEGTETTWETITVNTNVEYDFGDLGKHIVEVSHFNPQTEADIIKGIENRAISERKQLEANQ